MSSKFDTDPRLTVKPERAKEEIITFLEMTIPRVVIRPRPEVDTAPLVMNAQRKGYKVPVLEIEKLLPIFERITYQSVLDTMVEAGIVSAQNLKSLNPSTRYGEVALNTFKITMFLLERELRTQVEGEQSRYAPLTKEKLSARLSDITKNLRDKI